jgi:hypothetical protein
MSNKILAIYDNSDTGICEFSETAELARIHGDGMHITEQEFEFGNYIVLYTGRKPTTASIRKELGY